MVVFLNRLLTICLVLVISISGFGQNGALPQFEVASVKPASPDQRAVDLRDLPGRSSADHLSNARRDDRRGISGEVVATER